MIHSCSRKRRRDCRIKTPISSVLFSLLFIIIQQHQDNTTFLVGATPHHHGSSHSFNNYARAASLASEHAANLERLNRQRLQSSKPNERKEKKKKKSIEEGIQAAKRFPKVVLDETVEGDDDDIRDEDETNQELDDISCTARDLSDIRSDFFDDGSTCDDDEDSLLWGITSGFELEHNENNNRSMIDATKEPSRRTIRKRRKRYSKNEDRPSESPSVAPTSMPKTPEQDYSEVLDSSETVASATSPATTAASLIGTTLLNKFYIADQVRVGSTKSELYQCYHVSDLELKQHPLMIKLSHNTEQMKLEHRIYSDLYARLAPNQRNLFIQVYDWIPASDLTDQKVGFVMEAGSENLRGIVWRHGPMQGPTLKEAMSSVVQTINALHQLGTIWTEVKAENFVVLPDGSIKAVDLESLAAHGECLRCYSAETYPPEFPPDSLYNEMPQMPLLDYSFDIWGLGLVLLEVAIGEPLFTLQRTYDVEYIRERLKDPQGIVDEARQRMEHVDPLARDVILQCLVLDPNKRSTCEQLLKHEYFQD